MGNQNEYSHCIVCGRKLKNPEYRRIGMGLTCYKKQNKKKTGKVIQMELKL